MGKCLPHGRCSLAHCPPQGNLINQQSPTSVLFNASVAIFDPYENKILQVLEFPGISGDPALHIGVASPAPDGRHLTVLVDAAAAFNTGGQDVSGDNFVISYDLDAQAEVWRRNLTAFTKGQYGGFQDVEHDKKGNIYVVGSYPGTILRLNKDGEDLVGWYLPHPEILADTTVLGFAGLAALRNEEVLLTNNNTDGQIYRFDVSAPLGTPILVPTLPDAQIQGSDAIYLPPKYRGTVLLVAIDAVGVRVIQSTTGRSWTAGKTLGTIPNDPTLAAQGGFVTATVQMGSDKIFVPEEFFLDLIVEGTNAGSRSLFPQVNISGQVEALLG